MREIIIYSKDGVEKCSVKSLEYNGTYMGERHVSCNVSSPVPVQWAIGDYLVFRAEKFTMYKLPAATKSARINTYGKAFEYKSVKFSSAEEELRICQFLDVVPKDNDLHYTLLPNFSFYCEKPSDLAERIKANLDRMYPDEWEIAVNGNARFAEGVSLSFSSNSCWDALAQSNSNSNIDMDFIVDCYIDEDGKEHKKVTIGGAGIEILTALSYGKGNGLLSIDRTINESQAVTTRLYAYGNQRNLPYRFYNKQSADGTDVYKATNSVYAPNLMLPGFLHTWIGDDAEKYIDADGNLKKRTYTSLGKEVLYDSGKDEPYYLSPDGEKEYVEWSDVKYEFWQHWEKVDNADEYYCDRVWIDSINGKSDCGVLEGTKFFDGSDDKVEDVYPSIENFKNTTELVEAVGIEEAKKLNLCDSAGQRIYEQGALNTVMRYYPSDEIKNGTGNIPEKETGTPTFEIYIKNLGFNISDTELKADDTPSISMKTGACAGREFKILSCVKMVRDGVSNEWREYTDLHQGSADWCYKLKCEVVADDSIGQYFPNNSFSIKTDSDTKTDGDEFVLLGINMPTVYVDVAEKKLIEQAVLYLAENDHTVFTLSPKIDNIFMVRNPEVSNRLREGNYITVVNDDKGFEINEKLPISQLKIKYEKEIPEYEITMSDQQEASLAQRVSAEVKQTFSGFFNGTGSLANAYTDTYLKRGGDSTDGAYKFGSVNTGLVIHPSFSDGRGFSVNEDSIMIQDLNTGYLNFKASVENVYVQGRTRGTTTLISDNAVTIKEYDGNVTVYFKASYNLLKKVFVNNEICYYGIVGASGGIVWKECDGPTKDSLWSFDVNCEKDREYTFSVKYVAKWSSNNAETDTGVTFYLQGTRPEYSQTIFSGRSPKKASLTPTKLSLFDTSIGVDIDSCGDVHKTNGSDRFFMFGGAHYLGTEPIDISQKEYILSKDDIPAVRDAIQTLLADVKPVEFVFRVSDESSNMTVRSLSARINITNKLYVSICVEGEFYSLESKLSANASASEYKFIITKI